MTNTFPHSRGHLQTLKFCVSLGKRLLLFACIQIEISLEEPIIERGNT